MLCDGETSGRSVTEDSPPGATEATMARILVADDHEAVRLSLRRALESGGHEVAEAEDGRAALRLVEARPPDLVIADIYMPEMDGIEFLVRLVDRFPSLPIIAVSGGGHAPAGFLLEDARHLGAVATLEKPLSVKGVLSAVDDALGNARRPL